MILVYAKYLWRSISRKTIGPEYTTILVLTSTGNMSQLDCEQFKAICGAVGLSYWSQ